MIRELRKRAKMSQKAVAEYLGIHYTIYQRYEYGKRELPIHHALKLRELYKCTLDLIYGVGM